MKRTKPLRSSPLPRANRTRKAKNWTRAYGGKERVAFVKSIACLVCYTLPSENAHVSHSSAGMGRKGDACAIVPLCAGHHRELHRVGQPTFERTHGLNLTAWAATIEQSWRRFSGRPPEGRELRA